MPPEVVLPVAAGPFLPGTQPLRRTYSSSAGRSRKSNSTTPILLVVGLIMLLGLGIGAAVVVSLNQEPASPPHHAKQPGTEKKVDKTPPKHPTQPAKEKSPRPNPSQRTESTVSQPMPIDTSSKSQTVDQNPRQELTKARRALEQRDDDNFRLHITQTEHLIAKLKPTDGAALKADETHLRDLEKLLSSFWQAVREGADKKIPRRKNIAFRSHTLELIRREGDQLTYKFDGVEATTAIKKLPPRVAMYMALHVFGDNVEGKVAVVVFQLVDAEASQDSSCQRIAGRLLEESAVSNHAILKREREQAGKENKAQAQNGPPILGGTRKR
jgi:hypothetical protein